MESLPRVTVLAGFRWVNLSEDLKGTLPPERTVPFWDNQRRTISMVFRSGRMQSCSSAALFD